MPEPNLSKKWMDHKGPILVSDSGFDVIECEICGFRHIVPIPTVAELEDVYQHDYYQQEKPLYLERYREDLDWWNMVYTRRYEVLERFLPIESRKLLDIGSGPGFFLLKGQERGWKVKGIEPSVQAVKHSRKMGLDVTHGFFSGQTASDLETFDVINMGLVLEHIPEPAELLKLSHQRLNQHGLLSIIVPNDFNPFQIALRESLNFDPWWVAPPHHINYFNFKSLAALVRRCGFEVVHEEATFPIDMFLLMGDNYLGNDELGRICHNRRMDFELAMSNSGMGGVLENLYTAFAKEGVGREVVIFARRVS